MRTDITFNNARVYDFTQAEVVLGQEFEVRIEELDPAKGATLRWFSDNDSVLDIEVAPTGMSADFIAKTEGSSTILIMEPNKNIAKELRISVLKAILPPADTLEVKASEAVPK